MLHCAILQLISVPNNCWMIHDARASNSKLLKVYHNNVVDDSKHLQSCKNGAVIFGIS